MLLGIKKGNRDRRIQRVKKGFSVEEKLGLLIHPYL